LIRDLFLINIQEKSCNLESPSNCSSSIIISIEFSLDVPLNYSMEITTKFLNRTLNFDGSSMQFSGSIEEAHNESRTLDGITTMVGVANVVTIVGSSVTGFIVSS
jgi:hypothetical protein